MKLSNITQRKFIESYPGGGRKIQTPSGYKEIIEVHKTIKYNKFHIVLENGLEFKGAYNHVIIQSNGHEVYIKNSLNTIIKTIHGDSKVIKVINLNVEEHMYDISIDSNDELYYSDGILSHNSGKSVTVAIYLCWVLLFDKDKNIGIAANKAGMAKEFLDKTKNIFIELPIWLQQGIKVWNKTFIEAENGMRILTDATSGDSFRGFTINLLIIDECAFIKSTKWDEFSDSIFPSQSGLAWKKNIIISTAGGMNHFYQLIKGARNKTNGYINYEVDWEDVPRYNADGTKKTPEEFKNEVVAKYGIIYFNQNYGGDFMGSSHTLISADKLKMMEPQEPQEIIDGKLKIFTKPIKGHKYIMSVDAAKDGTDAFSVHITDVTNFDFKQVASAQLQIEYLLMPEYIFEWCEYYNNPYLIIENNEGAGQSVADQMHLTYEYENLHWDKSTENKSKKKKSYPGFRTTPKTRKQILQTMKIFIENEKLSIYDSRTISELTTFILQNNKYQADDGCKDDAVMSLAVLFAPFCNTKNFNDMKEISKILFSEQEQSDVKLDEIFVIGDFDDGTDIDEYQHTTTYTVGDFEITEGGFI